MQLLDAAHLIGHAQLLIFLFTELVERQQVHLPNAQLLQFGSHGLGGGQAAVEFGNDRDAGNDLLSGRHSGLQVPENGPIADAGLLLMLFRIAVLEIEQQQIDMLHKRIEAFG